MRTILMATLIGFGTGVLGTATGGLAATAIRKPSRVLSAVLLGLAGGVMLAIIGLDLFPEALRRAGLGLTSLGLASGVGLIYALDAILPHEHAGHGHREGGRAGDGGRDGRAGGSGRAGRGASRFARASLLIALGVALHNLPEGLAVGSGYASGTSFGFAVTALIFFQNVPEGAAVAVPSIIAGRSRLDTLWFTVLAGLPQAVGALVGAAVSSVSPAVLGVSLAFAGGSMLFIVGDELLPEAQELSTGHAASLGLVAGMLIGMVLSTVLTR